MPTNSPPGAGARPTGHPSGKPSRKRRRPHATSKTAACEGKIAYLTYEQATFFATRRDGRNAVYRCRFCAGWHIGNIRV